VPDVIIRQARLAGCATPMDIAVAHGRIAGIASGIIADAQEIDAGGNLLTRGFAESHIHLDKACILGRATNLTGTLEGAVAAVSEAKKGFTQQDIYARGRRVIEKAIVQGTNAMRTHVEIDPGIGLTGFHAIRQLKHDYRWAIDLDLCVFPQEGLTNNPGTEELLRAALDDGADLLGGCPYMDSDPPEHIRRIFAMAKDHDVDLDFHLDFDLDPSWRHLDEVARQTVAHGWQGRVTIGHVTKLSVLPKLQLMETAAILRDAGIAVTVLPATDLFLMGRGHEHSVPRGVAPAHLLSDAGICCTVATNNVLNPFTPFGDCSLTRMANLYANIAQLGTPDDLNACFAMVSDNPLRLMKRGGPISIGSPATFILVAAASPAEAIAEIARPLWGMKDGKLTFEHPAPSLHPPLSMARPSYGGI
jgi:cytosine deaminase